MALNRGEVENYEEITPTFSPEPGFLERGLKWVTGWLVNYSLLIGVALIWQLAGWLGRLPSYIVAPLDIFKEFLRLVLSGDLLPHLEASLYRALAGFLLGATFGVFFGLLSGRLRAFESFWDPLVSLTYPVPKIALLPVLLVWFGLGDTSKIVIIALSSFYPAFLNAYYGARGINNTFVWAGRNMGASPVQIFLKVVLPAALSNIFTGLRVALALSFVVLFSAELVGSREGLGFLIVQAEAANRFEIIYAVIFTIALLGFVFDRLLLVVRRRLLLGQELAEYGMMGN